MNERLSADTVAPNLDQLIEKAGYGEDWVDEEPMDDMSLHDLSPEDGNAWAEAALAEPDFTVVKAYFNSAGVVKHSVFVKVNGRWLMPGNEAYWCDTDGDLREQFESYEVVARPTHIDGSTASSGGGSASD